VQDVLAGGRLRRPICCPCKNALKTSDALPAQLAELALQIPPHAFSQYTTSSQWSQFARPFDTMCRYFGARGLQEHHAYVDTFVSLL
jgi:hypothetical protein